MPIRTPALLSLPRIHKRHAWYIRCTEAGRLLECRLLSEVLAEHEPGNFLAGFSQLHEALAGGVSSCDPRRRPTPRTLTRTQSGRALP